MYTIPIVKEFRERSSELLHNLLEKPEEYWVRRGENETIKLFRAMSERVPAYKDFLKKNGVFNTSSVQSIADLKDIPIIDKENYLLSYPMDALCWDGIFDERPWIISSTSGSTGEPFYFPRSPIQDEQFGLTAELYLRAYYGIDRQSTLFINCFALGVWIGGVFVYQATKHVNERGNYPMSIIAPGADKTEALKAVKNLAPKFDQVIIGGYGPLVKDLIDEGMAEGIDWSKYQMKYFFAAEGFTEGFRDYLVEHGGARDFWGGTLNLYGTADIGAMAQETPASVLIRRLVAEDPTLHEKVFSYTHRLPTFTQYIPELYFFEEVDRRLVCSAPGGIPLVRYDLKDRGEVWGYEKLLARLSENRIDLPEEIKNRGIQHPMWSLPFVSVYERNDLTVSIYSVNIYPQTIKKALEEKELQLALTGKFTMMVEFDEGQNQFLETHIELQPGVSSNEELESKTLETIVSWLNKENSEWRDFYADPGIRHKVTPRLTFWSHGDPTHFGSGGKQKWVKNK